MFQRLQVQLIVLFIALLALVGISVSLTYFNLQTKQQDTLFINLSGRQGMLVQQMTRLALQVQEDTSSLIALQEAKNTFSQTLLALQNGGSTPYAANQTVYLAGASNPEILEALDQVEDTWNQYRVTLDAITSPNADAASLKPILVQQSDELVQKTDVVVRLYEAASTSKLNLLRSIQIAFLMCAFALLSLGVWIIRASLLNPLHNLSTAIKRLEENRLDVPIQVEGPTEMRRLSEAFDEMRLKLNSARQELQQWNLRLEERVAQRTRELETLNEVSREIASRLDTQQVLNSVTDKARALLGGEIASLCLVDENRHWLKLQAVSGPKQAVIGDTMPAGSEFALAVLSDDHAMICNVGSCHGGCRMLSEEYRTSHLTAPLKIGNRVIGALCVGSPAQNQFAEESVGILTKLANVAAIALENARLFAQVEKVATLEERHRVAAEMHDGLGQTLSYLGLMTDQVVEFLSGGKEGQALERLNKTRETINKATRDVRHAINSLMDEDISKKDLPNRLKESLDEIASQHDLQADWQLEIDSPLNISEQTAEQVYKIASEALINVTRHAKARKVRLQIKKQDADYVLTVEDDGQGYDISEPKPNGHFGLQIMEARAKHINGNLKLHSTKGCGSQVILTWPQTIQSW